MTIALVTHVVESGDGQGRVNLEIARAALENGHHVVLVASRVSDALRSRDTVRWVPVPVDGIPTELLRNQVFAWRSARWLSQNHNAFDVLLANGAITWTAADVNAAHFVHSAWLRSPAHAIRTTRGPYAWYQGLYTAVNALWERWAFRQATTVVAVSRQVKQDLQSLGIPSPTIQVIPNGVDPTEFCPGSSARSTLDLPTGVPMGAIVGDLQTSRKNVDTVLHAMQRVPAVHLAVAGRTTGSPYPDLARSLGINDRVHFLGYCTDVPALLRSVDVCLCPSRYEPFSLVLLEALASGCPVITARTVGAAALLTEDAGWVLDDPDDVEGLTQALKTVVTSPSLLRSMGRTARRIGAAHSFDRMAHAYLSLLERHASTP